MLMRIPDGHKQCLDCSETKPHGDFYACRSGFTPACKECHKARERSRRLAQGERLRTRDRERYAANREPKLTAAKRWYAQNADRAKQKRAEYRQSNPDKIRANNLRRVMAQRGAMVDPHVTIEWLRDRDGSACHYCGVFLDFVKAGPRRANLEHMTPLARGGLHAETNCVLACRDCNFQKHTKTAEEFHAYRQSNSPA